MENNRYARTIVVILVTFQIVVAEITSKPTVTEVVVGGSTFLNCTTNSLQEINWFHTPFGSNQTLHVYGSNMFYPPYIGRFQMEKNETNGTYNLIIPVVIIDDAGVYECQDESGQGKRESAQLIVLDTNPVCEPHFVTHEIIGPNACGIEPSELIISCTVDYKGNEAPKLEWSGASDNKPLSKGVTHATIGNQRVVYNLTINGNSTIKDGDSYFCNTTRSATSNDGCKSGVLKVKGKVVDYPPPVDAAEICTSYTIAIISITVLLIVVIVILVAICCIRLHRPKKLRPRAPHEPLNEQEVVILTSPSEDTERQISDLELTLKKPKKVINEQEMEVSLKYKDEIQKKSDEIRKLQEQNEVSNKTIIQLQGILKDLKQRLYPEGNFDYAEKPTLARTITTDASKQRREPINGMAILHDELFVSHENNSQLEVYDSETFQFERNLAIEGMSHPMDIASCKITNCIYIIYREDCEAESHIMKLDPKGQLVKKWSTGGEHGRLSTYESNVIVCLFEKQVIDEYTRDGKLIRTVALSPEFGFKHPLHAIKVGLTGSHFAVCHGDAKDELHRVCIVDYQGNIIRELRQGKLLKSNVPICLVEDGERSILVADRENQNIRLLSCFLKQQPSLFKAEMKLDQYPFRICLDEANGRLFVAENKFKKKEWKDGRILVFNIV